MTDIHPSSRILTALTAQLVSAYLVRNSVSISDLPELIVDIHRSLQGTSQPESVDPALPVPAPAISVKKSVQAGHLVCLDCGKSMKMLKRHLRTDHQTTPEEYRSKWGLKNDYPMVAPDYSVRRSELAVAIGLGRSRSDNADA